MKYSAVWIDHAKALVVKIDEKGEAHLETITSGVEPRHHGGDQEGEHLLITNQQKSDHIRQNEIKAYMKNVLEVLSKADEIHVFGPGTAKFELKNAIEEEKSFHGKLKSCETTDKMTENQLIAHAKQICGKL